MGPRYVDSLQRSHKTSYADHEDQRSTIKKNVRSKFEEAMQAFARHLARVMGIRKPRVKILESSVSQGGKGGGKGDKGSSKGPGKSDPSGKANSASEASTVTKKKKAVKKKVTYAHAAADDSDESYNMSGIGVADDDDDIDVAIYKELAAYRKMLRTFKLKNGKPRYSKTSIDTKVQRYSEEMYATGTI